MSKGEWVVVPVVTEEDKLRVDEALRSGYEVELRSEDGWVRKFDKHAFYGSIYRWPANPPEPKATPLDASDMRSWMVLRRDWHGQAGGCPVGEWNAYGVTLCGAMRSYKIVSDLYKLSRLGYPPWVPATKDGLAQLLATTEQEAYQRVVDWTGGTK